MSRLRTQRVLWLLPILLLAATLRLIWPLHSPPGLQVDEASNVWNAACIGRLGVDEHGKLLPIFTTAEFGSYRSPLFLYFIVPFQVLLGVNAWSARLAPALAGVVSVWLMEWIGTHWFSRRVGWMAAALMAIDPWHLQLARWAHEASICPLLVLAPIALTTATLERKRPGWGLLAGLSAGAACYGYGAVRLFLPLLILGTACAIGPRRWRQWLKPPESRKTLRFWLTGFLVVFTPLLVRHLTDPNINKRARETWVWQADDSTPLRIEKAAARYLPHFDPIGMSFRSPADPAQATPRGFGLLGWYVWPLAVCGAVLLLRNWRGLLAARVLLIAVLIYPAGDLLNTHQGINALRSFPGAWAVLLTAAVGGGAMLKHRWSLAVSALVIVATTALYLNRFFGEFDRSVANFDTRNVNVLQACDWMRDRDFDAIFWTQTNFSFIYPVTAVGLGVTPNAWFAKPLERFTSVGERYAGADLVRRYGDNIFVYAQKDINESMNELQSERPIHRVAIVMRPDDLQKSNLNDMTPAYEIRDPQGKLSLVIVILTL